MIIIYTWILLIVEISTPKPKSINFAKFKRKRAPERLFPLQNVFFSLQNASERFWMFFFHASWTRFSTKGTSDMSRTAKTTTPVFLCVLFPHQASKSIFYWGSQKKSVLGSSRCIYIYIFYNTILYIYLYLQWYAWIWISSLHMVKLRSSTSTTVAMYIDNLGEDMDSFFFHRILPVV